MRALFFAYCTTSFLRRHSPEAKRAVQEYKMRQFAERRDVRRGDKSYLHNSYTNQTPEEEGRITNSMQKNGQNVKYEPCKDEKYRFVDYKYQEFDPRESIKSYSSHYKRTQNGTNHFKRTIYDLYKSNSKLSKKFVFPHEIKN